MTSLSLNNYEIAGAIVSILLSSYLMGTFIPVFVNGQTSQLTPMNASVQQGSILEPTLCLAYNNPTCPMLMTVSSTVFPCEENAIMSLREGQLKICIGAKMECPIFPTEVQKIAPQQTATL